MKLRIAAAVFLLGFASTQAHAEDKQAVPKDGSATITGPEQMPDMTNFQLNCGFALGLKLHSVTFTGPKLFVQVLPNDGKLGYQVWFDHLTPATENALKDCWKKSNQ